MSWWVSLGCSECGTPVSVDRFEEGGTYTIGGTDEARISVTYNYGKHFNFNELDGKTASEVLPVLEKRIAELGTDLNSDYWTASEGNVRRVLERLASWARKYPTAVFTAN
jgi:hypothetical protein